MATSQGYKCEFLDSVSDDFYCKKCNLVARRLSVTTCCGESFCQSCITIIQEGGKPCPECGEKNFTAFEHAKSKKRINSLRVYCSLKERGCGWSGTLEQLDTHLDPDQDNCQYVDTKCPLDCNLAIPKNKVEQHVAQHCAKRPYVCQHCNFKATYEEVVGKHLAECKYVPLQCPNLCGVTFERDFMEDHMKMCRLEEVGCKFSEVGCEDRFVREDQEEHTRQNSQKHLTLTATLAVKTKEQLQQKLLEQDKKHKEEEEKLKEKIREQEKRLDDQNKKLKEQEKKLIDQENERKKEKQKLKEKVEEINEVHKKKLEEQKQVLEQQLNSKLQEIQQILQEVKDKSVQNAGQLSKISTLVNFPRKFRMKNFSQIKAMDKIYDWFSPALYTHVGGYKFCIGVDANGYGRIGHGKSIRVHVHSLPGENDDHLNWPVKATFTIKLVNQQGREDVTKSVTVNQWPRYDKRTCIWNFSNEFHQHSKLGDFLLDDTLYFNVSEVELS